MSLEVQVSQLAQAIGNHTRDSVIPRLIPSGGTDGQLVVKVGSNQHQTAFIDPPSQVIGGDNVFDGGNF